MPCLCLLNEKHSEIETDLLFNAVNPLRQKRNKKMMKEAPEEKKNLDHFSICACHPCAGAMLIFSVSFQFYQMSPKRRQLVHLRCIYTMAFLGNYAMWV